MYSDFWVVPKDNSVLLIIRLLLATVVLRAVSQANGGVVRS